MNEQDEALYFADEIQGELALMLKYKILVIDDEPQIYQVTKLALSDFVFNEHKLEFLYANSAVKAKEILSETSDIAVALVDVVMEEEHAGLKLVEWVRNELINEQIRLIIRTGQPGSAPESSVIARYDINDYYSKTELTKQRLTTAIYGALRNWRDLKKIEESKQKLDELRLEQMQERVAMAKVVGLEPFLDALPIAAVIVDAQGVISAVNKKFEKLAYEPAIGYQFCERNFSDFVKNFGVNIEPTKWYLSQYQLKDGLFPITLQNETQAKLTISQINDKIMLFLQEL